MLRPCQLIGGKSHCHVFALVLDYANTVYFLFFQATRLSPKNVQYHVVDRLSEGEHV